MTPQALALGLCAGLISALVFASATTGPIPLRVVLYLLTPFSLYLAGLGLGASIAFVAAVAGCGVIFALSDNVGATLAYAISEAAPALLLTRLAMTREVAVDGTERWYPPGRLVIVAALIGGTLSTASMALQGADLEALTKSFRPAVEEFSKTQLPSLPGGTPLSEIQLDELTQVIVAMLPGALALIVMLTALGSLYLAGRVTLASGRLKRPWPDFSRMELPLGSAIVFLMATAASYIDDRLWLLADGYATAFRFAFALLGLAVVHYVTRGSPWRNFTLTTVYVALFIISRHALLILALIGLAETIFHYRYARKNAGGPPPPADPASS